MADKTTIYSELQSGIKGGYVTDHTQVKDVNLSDVTFEAFHKLISSGTLTPGHKYRITDPAKLPDDYLKTYETMPLTDGTVIMEAVDGSHLKPLMTETGYSELYRLAKDGKLYPGARYLITDYTNMGGTSGEQIIPGVSIALGRVQKTGIIAEALDRHTLSDKAKYVIDIQGKKHYFDCVYRMGVPQMMRDTYGWCYGDSPVVSKPEGKIQTADGWFDIMHIQTGKMEKVMIYMAGTEDSQPSLTDDTLFEFYTEGEALHVPQRRIGDYLYDCWGRHSGIVTWLKDDLGNEAPFDFYNLAFYISDPELSGLFGSSAAQYYPLFKSDTGSNWYNSLTGKDRRNYYNNVFKTISPIILDCTGTHDNYFDNAAGRIESGYNLKIVNSKVRLYHTTDLDIKDGAVQGVFTGEVIQGDGRHIWAPYFTSSGGGIYLQIEDQLVNINDLKRESATPVCYAELYRIASQGLLVPGKRYCIVDGGITPTPDECAIKFTPDTAIPYAITVTARDRWAFFDDVELVYNEKASQQYRYINFNQFKAKYDFYGTMHAPAPFWYAWRLYLDTLGSYRLQILDTLPDGTFIILISRMITNAVSLEQVEVHQIIYADSTDINTCTGWGYYDTAKGRVDGKYTTEGCEFVDSAGTPLCSRDPYDLLLYLTSLYRGTIYEFEDDLGNKAEFDFYNNYLDFGEPVTTLTDATPIDTAVTDLLGGSIPDSNGRIFLPLFTDYNGCHVLLDKDLRTCYTNNKITEESYKTRFIGKGFKNVTVKENTRVVFSGTCQYTDVYCTVGYIQNCLNSRFTDSQVNITNVSRSEIFKCGIYGRFASVPCSLYNVINERMLIKESVSHFTLYGNNVQAQATPIAVDESGIYNINPDLTVTKLGDTKTQSQPVIEIGVPGTSAVNFDNIGSIAVGQRVTFKLLFEEITPQVRTINNIQGIALHVPVTCTQNEVYIGDELLPVNTPVMICIMFPGRTKTSYINNRVGTYFDAILEHPEGGSPIFMAVDAGKDTNTTYSKATTSSNGLMSKEDKAKLDTYPETWDKIKDVVIQKLSLIAGANWVSFYVNVTLEQLQQALGANGLEISTCTDGTGTADLISAYDSATNTWAGDLTELDMTKMYIITTSAACDITLMGRKVPNSIEIVLNNGWNWIGFPMSEAVSVAEALAGFEAKSGDQIKSKGNGYAAYNAQYGWGGTLQTLIPGEGYRYYSNNSETKTLVFATEPIDVKSELSKKQDALVSGTNIKTINGQSILGEGDMIVNGEGSISTSRIIAGVLRFDGSNWYVLNNETHIPINITGIKGTTSDEVRITFPAFYKVNSLVVGTDETFAAAGIKCGASVGLDYATIYLRQDRCTRLFVTMDKSGSSGIVTRYEGDDRTDVSGFSVQMQENTSSGNYLRIEDSGGNIDGKTLPTIGGRFTSYLFGCKAGYMNIQLRKPDGSVSDYKGVEFQVGWPIFNATPVFTEYELNKGNIWVYGIMERQVDNDDQALEKDPA